MEAYWLAQRTWKALQSTIPNLRKRSFRLPRWLWRDRAGYLVPNGLDRKVAERHLPLLDAELAALTRVTQASRLKALPRVSITIIGEKLQSGVLSRATGSAVDVLRPQPWPTKTVLPLADT